MGCVTSAVITSLSCTICKILPCMFAVYVAACDLEKSCSFSTKVEIKHYICLQFMYLVNMCYISVIQELERCILVIGKVICIAADWHGLLLGICCHSQSFVVTKASQIHFAILVLYKILCMCVCIYQNFWPSMLWRCWLDGRKSFQPVKNWVVGCWYGYLSGATCTSCRFAYGPADATGTHYLLPQ